MKVSGTSVDVSYFLWKPTIAGTDNYPPVLWLEKNSTCEQVTAPNPNQTALVTGTQAFRELDSVPYSVCKHSW